MRRRDWFFVSHRSITSLWHSTISLATYVTGSSTNYVFLIHLIRSGHAPRYRADTVVQTASVTSRLRLLRSDSTVEYNKLRTRLCLGQRVFCSPMLHRLLGTVFQLYRQLTDMAVLKWRLLWFIGSSMNSAMNTRVIIIYTNFVI